MRCIAGSRYARSLALLFLVFATTIHARLLNADELKPEPEIVQQFEQFQKNWMKLLDSRGMYGLDYVEMQQDPYTKGGIVASYKKLGQIESSRVKKTGRKGCPYVGVLKYSELVFVSRGASPEAAKKGPFSKKYEKSVTEIFRYANGKWCY